ncbi:MAG: hypothetical protein LGB01_02900 [Sulfurovum sp.]|nr:hypothetical protein [Sulfurovum sp.]
MLKTLFFSNVSEPTHHEGEYLLGTSIARPLMPRSRLKLKYRQVQMLLLGQQEKGTIRHSFELG